MKNPLRSRVAPENPLKKEKKLSGFLAFFSFVALFFFGSLPAADTDAHITYEWLSTNPQTAPSTDYLPHLRRLFNTIEVRGFLECGCSFSTKYFLENSEKVLSIDFMAPSFKNTLYPTCTQLFSHYNKWTFLCYNDSLQDTSFNKACEYQKNKGKDYAHINSKYLEDLSQFFKKQILDAQNMGIVLDVAFVNTTVPLRGDMVNILLMNNIPIVIAHDTISEKTKNKSKDSWGWSKVKTPPDYIKITLPIGKGTTFWVKNTLLFVINSLYTYMNDINALNNNGDISSAELTEIADQLARF